MALDLISESTGDKEEVANELFNAMAGASLFGRKASTTAGLTWGYYGGMLIVSGVPTAISDNSILLPASAANVYIEASPLGVVSANTTGWTAGYTRLYTAVTGASTITSYTDQRSFLYAPQSQPFDLSGFVPGVPTASQIYMFVPVTRPVTFPSSLTGSVGKAKVAATAQTDFDIKKNGTSVGTMRFAAAATSASFIAASAISLAAGDTLEVVAPATPDATLSGVGFALQGTR